MTEESLKEAIKNLIIKRREAHGNDEEQETINKKLDKLYDLKYDPEEYFSLMEDDLFDIDRKITMWYSLTCVVSDASNNARVAQWWSVSLPRRRSRVRSPSRASFIAILFYTKSCYQNTF